MSSDLYKASAWAIAIGLAETPMFAQDEGRSGCHCLLLDGGNGSFALSIGDGDFSPELRQSWVWSADVPHHVWLRRDKVAVARWDNEAPLREFSLSSVSARLDEFYNYLALRQVDRNQSVVNHALRLFRFIRSAVSGVGGDDSVSVDVFLAVLAALSNETGKLSAESIAAEAEEAALDPETANVFGKFPEERVCSLIENFAHLHLGRYSLELNADLALRHASGLIFQESHFEMLRAPDPDLLGYVDAPSVRTNTRGGVHFTPPAIARILVERTIDAIPDLERRRRLVVLDPACGSGSFLLEALRVLRRIGYLGTLHLIGRDISGHAVKMARFALLRAARELPDEPHIKIEIVQEDFFASQKLPAPDLIVTNPPFIAFGALSDEQRQVMRQVFGDARHGRADFCTAFITHALHLLKNDGALGTLFPANLMFLENAKAWRNLLLQTSSLRFLASIGEHGLFAHALVQIGSMVLVKSHIVKDEPVLTVLTSDDRNATGEALRATRKISRNYGLTSSKGGFWEIAWLPERPFRTNGNWRLRSSRVAKFLERLEGPGLVPVKEIFHVRQGVQTGLYEVFVLPTEEWEALPKKEQRYFRKAIMNQSIRMGEARNTHMVFYPYLDTRPQFESEDELVAAVPQYFKSHLEPARTRLASRPAVRGPNRVQWWLLNRPRGWAANNEPRIVSKYFGDLGGFALDAEAEFTVVQGFGWNPRKGYINRLTKARQEFVALCSHGLLRTYWNILNSRPFMLLVSAFSKQVAGGQFDFGPRFINQAPIPDLVDTAEDESREKIVFAFESAEFDWAGNLARRQQLEIDDMVGHLYGIPLDEWPL